MRFSTLIWLFVVISASPALCTVQFDIWNDLLRDHVSIGTLEGIQLHELNYSALSNDDRLAVVLDQLAGIDLGSLNKVETLATFINAYNVFAANMVLTHPCIPGTCQFIKSIRDIGTASQPVWGLPAGNLGGKNVTLDDVENYLRSPSPWTEDPRIHAAIVCASISCPNLRMEAFTPDRLEGQLADQMQDFLSNTGKGLMLQQHVDGSAELVLSPIFLWFAQDFTRNGTVVDFILPYAPPAVQAFLKSNPPSAYTISYFTYDWDLDGPYSNRRCSGCP